MGRFIKLSAPEEPVEEDPLAGVANLFDASIVFIVGLMIALFSVYNMGDIMSGEGTTSIVTTDENGMQEIIVREGEQITAYRVTGDEGSGDGERLGSAYRLANGQIIYVPDEEGGAAIPVGAEGNATAP